MKTFAFITLIFLLIPCSASGTELANLALNKHYTYDPAPTYKLCTDELDGKQLTDGIRAGSSWGNTSTVGWQGVNTPVNIVIDLDRTSQINEVRVYTIGGGRAGVRMPKRIPIFVSTDNRRWELVGVAVEMAPTKLNQDGYSKSPVTFGAATGGKHGRFVKLLVEVDGPYLFIDEIEVLGTAAGIASDTPTHTLQDAELKNVFIDLDKHEEFQDAITITESFVKKSEFSDEFKTKNLAAIKYIKSTLLKMNGQDVSLKDLEALHGKVRAQIYKEFYKADFVCIPADPYVTLLKKTLVLQSLSQAPAINIRLWQSEHEAAAVNCISCTGNDIEFTAFFGSLISADGNSVANQNTFTLRRGVYVSAKKIGPIVDALVLQGQKPTQIQPGEVIQLWIDIYNPTLSAGTYTSELQLVGKEKGTLATIPIIITVEPLTMPAATGLNTYVWAYLEQVAITRNAIAEAAKDLAAHHTNVLVVHPLSVPFLYRSVKPQERQAEFHKLDVVLNANSYAQKVLLFMAFSSERKDRGRFGVWKSGKWNAEIAEWVGEIRDYFKARGMGYNRFALYPFDEQLCQEFLDFAQAVKAIDPNVLIFANCFGNGPADFNRFRSVIDIWCMPRSECEKHPEWLEKIKGFGKEVWAYQAGGPGKTNDPYSYYRLMPWWAYKNGLKGVGVWVYAEAGTSGEWDDYGTAMGYYALVYGSLGNPKDAGNEQIVPSRRWEAWRKGIEDYAYLERLQDAADRIETTDPARASQVRQFIRNQVDAILNKPHDYGKINEVRRQISNMLLRLEKGDSSDIHEANF